MYTAHVHRNLILKIFMCGDTVGTPITPMYSDPVEPKTFHQRTLDASQTIRNRPGTFKVCVSPYVSMRALIEVGDILSICCDTLFLIDSWVSNGNLYCKYITAAVSEIFMLSDKHNV